MKANEEPVIDLITKEQESITDSKKSMIVKAPPFNFHQTISL